jgi:hypothetical protein
LSATFAWAIKKRIALDGWTNPCKDVERLSEHKESYGQEEREPLLCKCQRSAWNTLYLLVPPKANVRRDYPVVHVGIRERLCDRSEYP